MKQKPSILQYRKNMKNAVKNSLILLFVFSFSTVIFGQTSEKLKKEQKRLETKIADTKMLLEKSRNKTASSLNMLQVIENQIKYREQLLRNYDNQIRSAELKVKDKEQQIQSLYTKVEKLKETYKNLLLYAYKHRNKYGKMMYIFSADSYFEAIKRNKYLQRISEIQKKQFILIKQHQNLIREEIAGIETEKKNKLMVISEKKEEKIQIQKDREEQEKIYQNFKAEEDKLLAELRKQERDRAVLKEQVALAIKREIEEAEAKRRKAEEDAKKAEASGTTTTAATTATFAETKEAELLSKSFEGNRGKLPWPVEKGTITENFGKNAHPTLKNVYTNNRGIDISAPKNAQVRAVFEGEVTSVLNIPGAGKVVIIKHGNYRTVYTNLQETYVKTGQKVSTKKVIGSLLAKDNESISTAHFEIHQVSGSTVTCLNPTLWVAQ